MSHAGWYKTYECCGCGGELSGDFKTYHRKQRIPCAICQVCNTVNDTHSIITKNKRRENKHKKRHAE